MIKAGPLVCIIIMMMIIVPSSVMVSASGDEEEVFSIYYDATKVSIVSGNFSVVVTKEWPRVIFWHAIDPFSPTFEAGFPRLQLFNDTDGNGVFSRSEATGTVFLDSNHVTWTFPTIVESNNTPELGEYVQFNMSAEVSIFNVSGEGQPLVKNWANVTFDFCLTQESASYSNGLGGYTVHGRTDIRIEATIAVRNSTWSECIAFERFLQGGGTTDSFLVTEDGAKTDEMYTLLSGRVDETVLGEDYTRQLRQTDDPLQRIRYTKDDLTSQAHFLWGTVVEDINETCSLDRTLRSSCYTTGAGLMLDSVTDLSNETMILESESVIGLEEDGFIGGVTDWIREYLPIFVCVVAAVACVAVLSYYMVRKRRVAKADTEGKDADPPKDAEDEI